jgi:hypothetical protein
MNHRSSSSEFGDSDGEELIFFLSAISLYCSQVFMADSDVLTPCPPL